MGFLRTIVGAFAYPIDENPTIAIMEAVFVRHKLNWQYVNCEVRTEDLPRAVDGARVMGWRGFNLSLPHKTKVIPYLDRTERSAELAQAVNCVVNDNGKLTGYNTDGLGFVESLRQITNIRGKSILVLGGGGAARAICIECGLAGAARLTLATRSPTQRNAIAELLERASLVEVDTLDWSASLKVPDHINVLVNATPVGLYPQVDNVPDLQLSSINPQTIVADVIANPANSTFLQLAARRGCRTVGGREMLVGQAAHNVRLWCGIDPDRSVMRAGLNAALTSTEFATPLSPP
jgi:shikimate dehydrogenase